MPCLIDAIRIKLRLLVRDSERADFKAYIDESNLGPIFGDFCNQYSNTAEISTPMVAHMAQHALQKLRHSFDAEIYKGQRPLPISEYAVMEAVHYRDTNNLREIAAIQAKKQHDDYNNLNNELAKVL